MSVGKKDEFKFNDELIDKINNEDYIKTITELADETEIVANEDIMTRTLHKLIANGTRLDSSFYEKLIQHKLLKPIDRSLMMTNGINTDSLVAESMKIFRNDKILSRMFISFGDLPMNFMRNVHFEAQISLKMSVIKEAMPRLFSHSVKTALISVFIGLKEGILHKDIQKLATAAMFHDISELHINPELQNPKHKMTDEDWAQIYAHPVVSYLILKEFPAYNPEISQTVIDHHEKLDGSGYPRGKRKSKISQFSQILAAAETIAAMIDKGYTHDELQARLKMSHGQYNKKYIYHVLSVLKDILPGDKEKNQEYELKHIDEKIVSVGTIIKNWDALFEKLTKQQQDQKLVHVINERINYLQIELSENGLDFDQLEEVYILLGENSEEWLHDINAIIEESIFKLRQMVSEAKRNWPEYRHPHKPRSLGEFLSQWIFSTESEVSKYHIHKS